MRRRTTRPKPGGSADETKSPFVPPYPPSWFDRLRARLDLLPISPYVLYGLLGVVLFILFTGS